MSHEDLTIFSLIVKDVRFPTTQTAHGSDAIHDPDYSCAYVTIKLMSGVEGNGLTFTVGRGTEIIVAAINSLKHLVVGLNVDTIFKDFAAFWRRVTNDCQLRWIGPEKGAIHLATAAIINALWDLWGKLMKKPVWRLLCDMDPEQLVSTIDFRYITDVLTKEEAISMLQRAQEGKRTRIEFLLQHGYPAYTTQAGWLGYSDAKIEEQCRKYMAEGFKAFKIKIGRDLEDDKRRLKIVRNTIGYENKLVSVRIRNAVDIHQFVEMVDANQMWDVDQAISWMRELAEFQIYWIEEPTSPDDIRGHAIIAKELHRYQMAVATGEMCANRVMFKQFLIADAMKYCQIDAARIGGVNEILSVYLMAQKLGAKVCPHAGGIGLCEMVQHLQMWDFVALSGSMDDRLIEYVDQEHNHFIEQLVVENAHYKAPTYAGYGTTLKQSTIEQFEFPNGTEWKRLFDEGVYQDPRK